MAHNWSSCLQPLEWPCGQMKRRWALGNQHVIRTFLGHVIPICNLPSWLPPSKISEEDPDSHNNCVIHLTGANHLTKVILKMLEKSGMIYLTASLSKGLSGPNCSLKARTTSTLKNVRMVQCSELELLFFLTGYLWELFSLRFCAILLIFTRKKWVFLIYGEVNNRVIW